MSFTHLQIRSGYSLMKSTIQISPLIEKASELKLNALALTDENVLYGVIPFYKACINAGIKPIIGLTTVIKHGEDDIPCILLAKNEIGYQSLIQISTTIQFSEEKKIILENNQRFAEGLICILPVNNGSLREWFFQESFEQIADRLSVIQQNFDEESFYLGIGPQEANSALFMTVKGFHDQYGFPCCAIGDVRYLNEKDVLAYDCLLAMKDGRRWDMKVGDRDHDGKFLQSSPEMEAQFSNWSALLTETKAIESRCNVKLDFNKRLIPAFPTPDGMNADQYLEHLCNKNLKLKYPDLTKEITNRLAYELDVIRSMKYSDYFLIVSDFINYAKKNNILVGPGRGSSAGSIVAYLLGITEVDPIKYNLLFERFLNPERQTMPDIDVDFSDTRRDEVIQYVREKYGEDRVAQIITFGTFAQRSLIRELIKTMNISDEDARFLLKEIPLQSNRSLAVILKESKELNQYVKSSNQLKLLMMVALQLEGLPRHISTHAAGVVITEQPLTKYVPLTAGQGETPLTQYAMNELEAIGLLKMDFLGLRNLTLIENVLKSIYYTTKQKLKLQDIPANDEKTFQLLREGRTNGVFQLESRGMKKVLKQLEPTDFEDIVAVNALFRPGPMDFIPVYIARKHQKQEVTYPHPDLKPILEQTYGVLVYQEQIMQIAHRIAGFSFGEADVLRRAVSKKNATVMKQQQKAFIDGCINNGYDRTVAEEIFNWIVKFSNYGFPRSHAVAYSIISYQIGYLKANYPAAFFAQLLSSSSHQHDKVTLYMQELKQLGVDVLPPSINKSFGQYTVEKGKIRVGFSSIKGVGRQAIQEMIAKRKEGRFTSLFDFCLRVSFRAVNRATIENLILAGCFDELYPNRASLLASIDQAMEQGELFGDLEEQPSFLGDGLLLEEVYTKMEDFSVIKKLTDERELLGFYISSHPLKEYRKKLRASGYVRIKDLTPLIGQRKIRLAVIVQQIKPIRTKRGDSMAFVTVGDETGELDTVVFPDLYRNTNRWLEEEMILFITGKPEMRKERLQFVADSLVPFDEQELQVEESQLFIRITKDTRDTVFSLLAKAAKIYPGNVPVLIYDEEQKKAYQLHEKYALLPSRDCLAQLRNYFGKTNVVLKK